MNREGEEMRDETLSAALSRLEVPEHAPGFEDRVLARLREEVATREISPRTAETERLPARRPRVRRRARRRLAAWLPAAAAVVLAAIVVVTVGEQGIGRRVATAAEVRAAVAGAFESADSVSGTLVERSWVPIEERRGASREQRWRFTVTARGDFRLTRLGRPGDVAYDAGDNIERSLNTSASIPDSDVLFGAEITGLAPGPPDQSPSTTALDRSLGAAVRALASSGGGEVKETRHEGRAAWVLETELPVPNYAEDYEFWPNHLEVVVDKETGFPVRALASRDDDMIYEIRIEDLEVDGDVRPDAFTLDFPPGVEVSRSDAGFRRVSLEDVAAVVGYDPLVPRSIPEGYELAEVTVARRAGATGAFQGNPATIKAVSLSYRRGLDQLIVTTRLVGDDASAWSDPFATGEGSVREPERVTFATGTLAGHDGELVIDPLVPPHVSALTEELVVTVSGDLTRDELLEVAESLEPHRR
jgi:outer membrane lipoprotein-sorting protein